MTIESLSKMAVAYSNLVNPTLVSTINSANITSWVSGFPLGNLEYEDPWTMMKTASLSGAPTITFTFVTPVGPRCIGLLNHNLTSAGYSNVEVFYDNGSTWVSVASRSVATGDADIFMSWNNVVTSTQWRVGFTSGSGVFYLGSVFIGYRALVERNPTVNQVRATPVLVEDTAGGARQVSFGANKRSGSMQLEWERTTLGDVEFWRQLPKYALVGVLPPEQADAGSSVVVGQESFWGYVTDRTMTPRGPGGINTTQPARYGLVVNLEGAV